MNAVKLSVLATHVHEPGGLGPTLEFLKRTRSELRQLRKAYVWERRILVCDVNRDVFEIVGLGYGDPDVIPILHEINAAYDPTTLHNRSEGDCKEFNLGRRHPWAEDRVM